MERGAELLDLAGFDRPVTQLVQIADPCAPLEDGVSGRSPGERGRDRPQVQVARNFEQEDVESPDAAFSASIVNRVTTISTN